MTSPRQTRATMCQTISSHDRCCRADDSSDFIPFSKRPLPPISLRMSHKRYRVFNLCAHKAPQRNNACPIFIILLIRYSDPRIERCSSFTEEIPEMLGKFSHGGYCARASFTTYYAHNRSENRPQCSVHKMTKYLANTTQHGADITDNIHSSTSPH